MHLRAVLRGILRRTNSSSSTRSSSASTATATTAETRPTSSSGFGGTRTGGNLRIEDSITEHTTGVETNNNDEASKHGGLGDDERDRISAANCEDEDRGSRHKQSLGPRADRRFSEEGIKLQVDETAEAAGPPPPQRPEEQQQQHISDADADTASNARGNPTLLVHCPTPDDHIEGDADADSVAQLKLEAAEAQTPQSSGLEDSNTTPEITNDASTSPAVSPGTEHPVKASSHSRPSQNTIRRQSLVNGANTRLLRTLLDPTASKAPFSPLTPSAVDYFSSSNSAVAVQAGPGASFAAMLTRKIWVKRPGASPTMVSIKEDDLVDDVRDMIIRKYANSLGRTFDSPDVTLRITSRVEGQRSLTERLLGPDEEMCRTLDSYYPGGQTADEALLIDVPQRRTPRPSPRAPYHALDEFRPAESGNDYFPPMPAVIPPSAPHSNTSGTADGRQPHLPLAHPDQRSIAVLSTGQLPPLPSPGSVRRHRDHRPKYARQHTSSPTILSHISNTAAAPQNLPNLTVSQHLPIRTANRPRLGSNASEKHPGAIPAPPPLPTPPAPEAPPTAKVGSTPPTPAAREQSTLRPARPRRSRKPTPTNGVPTAMSPSGSSKPFLASSMLDNSVPPINVLIVEDNIINLKLLEAFMKRLKVRWSTAMNGQIAVNKWRAGGFHLVLMDIQLPIMSGLEATKEIRRLERVNGIGVFSNSAPNTPAPVKQRSESLDAVMDAEAEAEAQAQAAREAKAIEDSENDKLNVENGLFKSPVIIVALTASSLQSDRHEALAAGCNDFLTKPVNFVWLERKVKEWGCMQALIDFDGWRKWKDFAGANRDSAAKALPASTTDAAAKAKERKAKRASRASMEGPASVGRAPPAAEPATSGLQNGTATAVEDGPQNPS